MQGFWPIKDSIKNSFWPEMGTIDLEFQRISGFIVKLHVKAVNEHWTWALDILLLLLPYSNILYSTVHTVCILNIHQKKNFLFGIKILAQHLDKSLADFWTSLLSCVSSLRRRDVWGGEGIIEKEKVCSRVRKIMPNSLVYSPENTTGNCV